MELLETPYPIGRCGFAGVDMAGKLQEISPASNFKRVILRAWEQA